MYDSSVNYGEVTDLTEESRLQWGVKDNTYVVVYTPRTFKNPLELVANIKLRYYRKALARMVEKEASGISITNEDYYV